MRPYKVLIFIVCVMACLAELCLILPNRVSFGGRVLQWPTFSEVLGNDTTHAIEEEPETEIPEFPVYAEEEDTIVPPAQPDIPKISVDSTTDSRVFLQSFYASLAETGSKTVRIMHYGDSQIEEDRMTMQLREIFQKRYGGRGVGLMPLVQTIPGLTVKQQLYMSGRFVTPMQGPRRYFVYGFKRDQRADRRYGILGQMAEMNDSLVQGSEEVMAVCTPQPGQSRYTRWRVIADSSVHYTFSGDTVRLNGRGNVYALSQECETGVIVDNIPMRGCLGNVFTKMDSALLASFYRTQNVRLIIMQFGGNAIPFNQKPSTIQSIVKGLREQVRFLQHCAPEASILFIGPSDMLTQENGEWQTFPMVPYMDRLLRKMALEENIAYFSLYRWMGGSGSMIRWQEIGLAGSDGIHFYRSGAKKAGDAIGQWLLEPMEEQGTKEE